MTQTCHKDTHLNQQCCDSKHNEGQDNARGSRTIRNASPNPNTGHHHTRHPRHSARPPSKRKGGCPHANRRDWHYTPRPSLTMPPHHPRYPHPTPMPGDGRQRGTPLNKPHTHSHHHTRHGTPQDSTIDSTIDSTTTQVTAPLPHTEAKPPHTTALPHRAARH